MQSATTAAALSLHLPVRQEWLDRRREEIIEPDLPIVDPHHHLVDRPETGRYLLPELLADLGSGHNITATVYLEWLSMYRATGLAELRPVGEIEFANGVAAMAGNYGFVPHTLALDGDPIDVLVVGPAAVVPGAVVRCRRSCAIRSPISSAITKTWKPANGSTSRVGRMPTRPPP